MNIFHLDENPIIAASYHCDKHVIKMILESAQMMSTATYTLQNKKYEHWPKPTMRNHPCNIWIRRGNLNYNYLWNLAVELCNQYTLRYNKVHKYDDIIRNEMISNPNTIMGECIGPKCMPDSYKVNSIVESYRNYYKAEKIEFAKYKLNNRPEWL